ncbi:MAG: TerD family protein [Candidatus Melainabacteria bacterium]|nr:TerD family protein [Candidatus Melainabacteria bacterium]
MSKTAKNTLLFKDSLQLRIGVNFHKSSLLPAAALDLDIFAIAYNSNREALSIDDCCTYCHPWAAEGAVKLVQPTLSSGEDCFDGALDLKLSEEMPESVNRIVIGACVAKTSPRRPQYYLDALETAEIVLESNSMALGLHYHLPSGSGAKKRTIYLVELQKHDGKWHLHVDGKMAKGGMQTVLKQHKINVDLDTLAIQNS